MGTNPRPLSHLPMGSNPSRQAYGYQSLTSAYHDRSPYMGKKSKGTNPRPMIIIHQWVPTPLGTIMGINP